MSVKLNVNFVDIHGELIITDKQLEREPGLYLKLFEIFDGGSKKSPCYHCALPDNALCAVDSQMLRHAVAGRAVSVLTYWVMTGKVPDMAWVKNVSKRIARGVAILHNAKGLLTDHVIDTAINLASPPKKVISFPEGSDVIACIRHAVERTVGFYVTQGIEYYTLQLDLPNRPKYPAKVKLARDTLWLTAYYDKDDLRQNVRATALAMAILMEREQKVYPGQIKTFGLYNPIYNHYSLYNLDQISDARKQDFENKLIET